MRRWLAFEAFVVASCATLWLQANFWWALALLAIVVALAVRYRAPKALPVWEVQVDGGYSYYVVAETMEGALDVIAIEKMGPGHTGVHWVTQMKEKYYAVAFDVTRVDPGEVITSKAGEKLKAAKWARSMPEGGLITEVDW